MPIAERFKIIDPLTSDSSGKFGNMFKGVEKKTGKFVVIKALAKEKSNSTALERLRNEARYSFEEEGLPEILEFYESETECILVRNFTNGITIDKYWDILKKRQRLPFLLEFLKEFERLQRILNDRSFVHCDIRPGNLLIESNGPIKLNLIDFGMAIKMDEPETRNILFPLGYAAPELILNRLSLIRPQTDQFSLGVLVWRLYTGKLPLTHPNPSIFTNLQLTHPLPDHTDLPKGMYQILLKMTNKHQFEIPPNRMNTDEVDKLLLDAINGRYSNISEVINDLSKLPHRSYLKISFR